MPSSAFHYNRYCWFESAETGLQPRPVFIRSGAIHYFRFTSQAEWRERLTTLKQLGYNTVDVYIHWASHNPKPGVYDFSGARDIEALFSLIAELGLWIIVRPGPYINAETASGGFPAWLVAQHQQEKLLLRHRQDNGDFCWSEPYYQAVKTWFEVLLPKIAPLKNLLMIQVENEFATNNMEPEPLSSLIGLVRAAGITAPTFHNDLYVAGLYADVTDLYTFDHYSVTTFDTAWQQALDSHFAVIDSLEERLRDATPHGPLAVAELQAGWFGIWGGPTQADIRQQLGHQHITLSTKSVLAQGITVFNHYMAIGSTNWGNIGSSETVTSYDFTAPIDQWGQVQPNGWAAWRINQQLQAFPNWARSTPVARQADWHLAIYALRRLVTDADSPTNSHWLFVRNTHIDQTLHVPHPLQPEVTIIVEPLDMLMLPVAQPLAAHGITLDYTSAEVLHNTPQGITVLATQPCSLQLTGTHGRYCYQQDIALKPTETQTLPLEKELGQAFTLTLVGASARPKDLPSAKTFQHTDAMIWHTELETGTETQHTWQVLSQVKCWEQLLADDTLATEPHQLWYRITLPKNVSETLIKTTQPLRFNYRHHGAWWLKQPDKGWMLLHQQTQWYNVEHESEPEPIALTLPNSLTAADKDTQLIACINSLGRPKGFFESGAEAQGLWPSDFLAENTVKIQIATQRHAPELLPGWQQFQLAFSTDTLQGASKIAVQFEATWQSTMHWFSLYLNGTLIGRYWEKSPHENTFILPAGLLRHKGFSNTLKVFGMAKTPQTLWEKPQSTLLYL